MNVQVLEIRPGSDANSWNVWLAMPNQHLCFCFVCETVSVGKYQGWSLTAEPRFYQTFQFNQHITRRVNQLVQQVIQGDSVDLPVNVGHFYSPEAAQAEMLRRRTETAERAG
jgi:hypothetical protein